MKQRRRWLALLLTGAVLTQTGCGSSLTQLTREELIDPEPARAYEVYTLDGGHWTFISLHLEGDFLVGTARITTRTVDGVGEEARTNITNRYEELQVPWAEVERVEVKRRRSTTDRGIILAAGSIAVGVAAFLLISGGSDDSSSGGGGGKEF